MCCCGRWLTVEQRGRVCVCVYYHVCILSHRNKEASVGADADLLSVCVSVSVCLLYRQASSCGASASGLATKIGHAGEPASPFLPRCLFHFLYLSPWTVKVLLSNYRLTLAPTSLSFFLPALVPSHYNPQLLLPWLPRSVLECTLEWKVTTGSSRSLAVDWVPLTRCVLIITGPCGLNQ